VFFEFMAFNRIHTNGQMIYGDIYFGDFTKKMGACMAAKKAKDEAKDGAKGEL